MPEQQKGIGAEPFPRQGGPQRQAAIQQQVPGMIRAALPFAGQVEAGIELRHPIEGFAAGQLLGEERRGRASGRRRGRRGCRCGRRRTARPGRSTATRPPTAPRRSGPCAGAGRRCSGESSDSATHGDTIFRRGCRLSAQETIGHVPGAAARRCRGPGHTVPLPRREGPGAALRREPSHPDRAAGKIRPAARGFS